MKYRRTINRKNLRNKNLLSNILALGVVISLSLLISSNLANFIYKGSAADITTQDILDNQDSNKINVEDSKETEQMQLENYSSSLLENNMILFQGGVFNDLDNAEDFKENLSDKTLASIVNDGKYERIILGVATKSNFLEVVNFFKDNNIQFVKQVYKIPLDKKYNKEILHIIEIFSEFILKNTDEILNDSVDVKSLKKQVTSISPSYEENGSYKIFNDLKDLILELDDESSKKDLESVLDFIWSNFEVYKS